MSVKLHLGCGPRFIPGFVHVDLADYEHIDYKTDVRSLGMFADESVDMIYACHVLEYFDWLEAVDVLREWRRLLVPDGLLRLAVPNFEALVEVYRATGNIALLLGSLYGRIEVGKRVLYHRTVYDFRLLAMMLRAAGYRAIRLWDWRETEHAHIDDSSQSYYPHMDKEKGLLLSLNMEAEA